MADNSVIRLSDYSTTLPQLSRPTGNLPTSQLIGWCLHMLFSLRYSWMAETVFQVFKRCCEAPKLQAYVTSFQTACRQAGSCQAEHLTQSVWNWKSHQPLVSLYTHAASAASCVQGLLYTTPVLRVRPAQLAKPGRTVLGLGQSSHGHIRQFAAAAATAGSRSVLTCTLSNSAHWRVWYCHLLRH
jgi:hypothetical protein